MFLYSQNSVRILLLIKNFTKIMKKRIIDSIDKSIIESKNSSSSRRVEQLSSSLQKLASEVIHGECGDVCSEFSVINCHMSKDLKYLDIFICFFNRDDKDKQSELISLLNYDDLSRVEKMKSKFYKVSLKQLIVKKILHGVRLRIVPDIRFKIATEQMYFEMMH
jgi:ribosome-binding factor A